MRTIAAATAMLTLAACTSSEETTGTDTPTVPFVPPPVVDTGYPPGELGNIHLSHHVNTGISRIYASFTKSNPGYINFSECALDGVACLGAIPGDEEDFNLVDPDVDVELETITSRFAGFDIDVGPFTLPYRESAETKFGYYVADVSAEPWPEGMIGARWGGQFEEFDEEDLLEVSPPIELIQPRVNASLTITNGEQVPFEWVPTGKGFVTMVISTQFTLSRMYLVEDDGYYNLDVDSLGLTNDLEDLTIRFTRWNTTQIRKFGHVIDLLATTDASFSASYVNIGARERVFTADSCTQAQGLQPLQAGGWYGFLGTGTNDLDPTNGCLSPPPPPDGPDANGQEVMLRLEVEPLVAVAVDYNTYEESPSVYFVSDCDDANTCFEGADTSIDPNVHEYINYFNPTDETRVVYLVADTSDAGSTVFTVDVTMDPLLPPDMYDTCALAQAAVPTLTTANYYADFVAYTNTLNPGTGGCTGTSLSGAESMTPITLLGGQTLTVNVSMPGGDPGIYLLYNCVDPFSCPIGADQSLASGENLVYVNQSMGTENLYLVVDSKNGLRPYFLGVSIF